MAETRSLVPVQMLTVMTIGFTIRNHLKDNAAKINSHRSGPIWSPFSDLIQAIGVIGLQRIGNLGRIGSHWGTEKG